MRLFVALRPPEEVLAHVVEATAPWRDLDPAVRWVPSDRLHLTVAFFGEVAPRRAEAVCPRLGRAAARTGPMRLRMYGGLRLGAVLATRITGDVAALAQLAGACAAAARHAGVEVADRPLRAHLTLARARDRSGDRPDLRGLARRLSGYEGPWWLAESIELVHSRLGSTPQYETLERWRLGPRAGGPPARV